jgi:2'-5' RNA ligase
MPFAVGLALDSASATAMADLGTQIRATLAPTSAHDGEEPAHLTLALAINVDLIGVERLLAELAEETHPLAVTFSHVGVFPGEPATLFLAPVVTDELLAFHARFHRGFESLATEQSPYYLPGRWVPHCSIVANLPSRAVPGAIDLCLQRGLPRDGRLTRIGLAEFPPLRFPCVFDFQ